MIVSSERRRRRRVTVTEHTLAVCAAHARPCQSQRIRSIVVLRHLPSRSTVRGLVLLQCVGCQKLIEGAGAGAGGQGQGRVINKLHICVTRVNILFNYIRAFECSKTCNSVCAREMFQFDQSSWAPEVAIDPQCQLPRSCHALVCHSSATSPN